MSTERERITERTRSVTPLIFFTHPKYKPIIMPSGAKKRKAAKKKKEKEANINPSPNNPEGTFCLFFTYTQLYQFVYYFIIFYSLFFTNLGSCFLFGRFGLMGTCEALTFLLFFDWKYYVMYQVTHLCRIIMHSPFLNLRVLVGFVNLGLWAAVCVPYLCFTLIDDHFD